MVIKKMLHGKSTMRTGKGKLDNGNVPKPTGYYQELPISNTPRSPSIIRNLKRGWHSGWKTLDEHNRKYDLRENEKLLNSLGFDEFKEIAGPKALRHIDVN